MRITTIYIGDLTQPFVALNPKIDGTKSISDYYLISLLNGVHKISGKVLATRLNSVLPLLVSKFHCGGIQGRHIHEGVLIANEIIDSRLKEVSPNLAIKIDFRKTIRFRGFS